MLFKPTGVSDWNYYDIAERLRINLCGSKPWYLGHVKRTSALEHTQKCVDSDYPVMAKSIIRIFALHSYIFSIEWFCKRTVKALIRLRGCTSWSGPSLLEYARLSSYFTYISRIVTVTNAFYACAFRNCSVVYVSFYPNAHPHNPHMVKESNACKIVMGIAS